MYDIFLALHVLFAGLWVANLPVVLILNKLSKRAQNTSGEVHYMAAAGRIGMVSVHVPDGAEALSFETIRADLRRFWRAAKSIEHYA